MKNKYKRSVLIAASASILTAFSATAATNTVYQAGDLMLYFQQLDVVASANAGSAVIANTVYVDLGAATNYRGTAIGTADVANSLNFMNINSTLVSAFGAGWATDSSIYAGVAGCYSGTSNTVVTNGDISRTLYVSAARDAAAVPTDPWKFYDSTPFTGSGGAIVGQNGIFGTSTPDGVHQAAVAIGTSLIDNKNPLTWVDSNLILQEPAFINFDGGVQQVGKTGSLGAFGPVSSAEFALDLYRMVPTNGTNPNQIHGIINGTERMGSLEGTIIVGAGGGVSFLTDLTPIPEPSALLLTGLLTASGLTLRNRRRSAR